MNTASRATSRVTHDAFLIDIRAPLSALKRKLSKLCALSIVAISSIVSGSISAHASTIIVANDEWALSDTGFANAPTTGQFVSNLVHEFGPNIHAYSYNHDFSGASLAAAMSAAGAKYTWDNAFPFDLAHLSKYDGLLLGGYYLLTWEMEALNEYVANGGNVYLAVGANLGGPNVDSLLWAPFLDKHGISVAPYYNHIAGTIPVGGDPIFDGVNGLYQNDGNSLFGSHVVCCGNEGLYAVVREVPEPGTLPLLVAGMLGVAIVLRGRRRTI
jgi:hypothetical protein